MHLYFLLKGKLEAKRHHSAAL